MFFRALEIKTLKSRCCKAVWPLRLQGIIMPWSFLASRGCCIHDSLIPSLHITTTSFIHHIISLQLTLTPNQLSSYENVLLTLSLYRLSPSPHLQSLSFHTINISSSWGLGYGHYSINHNEKEKMSRSLKFRSKLSDSEDC